MSRGIGKTQQQILDLLKDQPDGIQVPEVADAIGCSASAAYRAVRSLKERGLVFVTRSGALAWRGLGEYGPLIKRTAQHGPEVPTARVIRKGDPWPWPDQFGNFATATSDVELVHGGMPTPPALIVWNPERYMEVVNKFMDLADAVRARLGQEPDPDDHGEVLEKFAPL